MLETDRLTQDDVRQIGGDEIRGVLVDWILARKGKKAVLVTGGTVDWIERDYPIEKGLS